MKKKENLLGVGREIRKIHTIVSGIINQNKNKYIKSKYVYDYLSTLLTVSLVESFWSLLADI